MNDFFFEYIRILYGSVPFLLYCFFILVLIISVILIWIKKGRRTVFDYSIVILFFEYGLLLYCSTVFLRETNAERMCKLLPFWSYFTYFRGEDDQLLPGIIMNVLVFVPIGLLACIVYNRWCRDNKTKQCLVLTLLVGFVLSFGIELLQYLFKKGTAELDDVIHNTLGCVAGFGIYSLIRIAMLSFHSKRIRLQKTMIN